MESNGPTVGIGDTINATITLDQSFTIPSSVDKTWVELTLGGSNFPAVNTETIFNSVAFFNLGVPGLLGTDSNCSTNERFASCNLFFPPENSSITFDTAVMSFTIQKLGTTTPGLEVTLDSAQMSYFLFSPVAAVPEPETYALLLAGLGLIGTIARRRKSRQA